MPKTRPQDGDINWGETLNQHLAQLQGDNGGINTAASDPTLTSDDEGYTYVNTSSNELRQWDGSSWSVILTETTESTDINYDNTSSGLSATTIQDAIDEVAATSIQNADEVPYTGVPGSITENETNVQDGITTLEEEVEVIRSEQNTLQNNVLDLRWFQADVSGSPSDITGKSDAILIGNNTIGGGAGDGLFAFGRGSSISGGNFQIVIGLNHDIAATAGNSMTIIGGSCDAQGNSSNSTFVGKSITGTNAVFSNAFGSNIDISGINAAVFGHQADATANDALALGSDCVASAVAAVAIGQGSNATANAAVQIGSGTNNTASSLQFLNNAIANDTSIQLATQSTGSAPASTPSAGTAVFDTSNDTLYIYNGSTWIAK